MVESLCLEHRFVVSRDSDSESEPAGAIRTGVSGGPATGYPDMSQERAFVLSIGSFVLFGAFIVIQFAMVDIERFSASGR